MSDRPTIVELDRDSAVYLPGEMLTFRCRVPDERVEALHVTVLWYTEGKGDEDKGILLEERVPGQELHDSERFEVRLPSSPLSYNGVILKIHWCVRAEVTLLRGREWKDEVPFQLGNVAAAQVVHR
jgi:hypothetical protein